MSPTFNSFVKCSEVFHLSLNTMCYSVEQSYGLFEGENATKQQKQTTECLRGHKKGLGTNSFNGVFLKIYPHDPPSKFQKLVIGFD